MADFLVDRPGALGPFLRRQGVQRWRISILIAHSGVLVMRQGTRVTPLAEDTRLAENDLVRMIEPPPAAVTAALAREATQHARDLAFVPGTSGFDEQMKNVMRHRPQTNLFADTLITSLRGFISALGRSDQVTHPIRHLLIGSHANPEGLLFMQLDTLGAGHITYEQLEEAARTRRIEIAAEHLEPRPEDASGQSVPAQVHIHGCRIGMAPPYLRKLKEALGNRYPVSAPKYFQVAAEHVRPAGYVEYLAYSFTIARPTAFRNRAAAVTAFSTAGFTRYDGTPVPPQAWARWVPDRIARTSRLRVSAISPIGNTPFAPVAEFRVRQRRFLEQDGSIDLESDPRTEAARKRAIAEALAREEHGRYRSTHPFPEYVRYGHATLNEFMDSWSWTFRYEVRAQLLHFNARRVEYTVVQPIVDPANNRLFLNFYPSGPQGSVLEMLLVTDTRFFETV